MDLLTKDSNNKSRRIKGKAIEDSIEEIYKGLEDLIDKVHKIKNARQINIMLMFVEHLTQPRNYDSREMRTSTTF